MTLIMVARTGSSAMTKQKTLSLSEIASKQSKMIDKLVDMLRDTNEKLELLRTQLKTQRGDKR